jgi:hypothetical protein
MKNKIQTYETKDYESLFENYSKQHNEHQKTLFKIDNRNGYSISEEFIDFVYKLKDKINIWFKIDNRNGYSISKEFTDFVYNKIIER